MSQGNVLHIVNHFDVPITVYVSDQNFNCCDAPLPSTPVGVVPVDQSCDLTYARKDGHGCDGRQGQFQLAINIKMTVDLNFDSSGVMAPPSPVGCRAALSQNPDNTFTLIVYA